MERCEGCSKIFKLKAGLQHHLTTTVCGKKKEFECKHCTYTTLRKNNFTRHVDSCKFVYAAQQLEEMEKEKEELYTENQALLEKLEEKEEELSLKVDKIKLLRRRVKDLELQLAGDEGRIEVYKERPSTINHTKVNNYINPKLLQVKCDTIRPFTIETVREDVQAGKFTFDRFIKAEKGILEFVSDIIAQDTEFSYVCTDMSRQKFHRLVESREWKDDNGATFLNKVLDELNEPTKEHYKKITDMMVTGDRDTADFLRAKTKTIVTGITCPSSKSREVTFNKIRNDVKNLATI